LPCAATHDNLAEILIEIAKELNIRPDKILNKIRSRPELEELRQKEEQIQNLKKEWDEL